MQSIFFINTDDQYSFYQHYQSALKRIPKEFKSIAVSTYNANNTSVHTLIDEASSTMLGVPLKIIIVNHYDKLTSKKEFIQFLEESINSCILFLLKEKPKTPPTLSPFIKKNRSKILEINLYQITPEILIKRVINYFQSQHITYNLKAVQQYVSIFQYQHNLLLKELEKISLYLEEDNKNFNFEVLNKIALLSPQYNIFQIINFFFNKNIKMTLISIKSFLLTDPNNFILLQTLLIKEAKKIIIFKELQQIGMTNIEIFKELKLNYKFAQDSLLSFSKNFKLKKIEKISDSLNDIELILKTNSLQTPSVNAPKINMKGYELLLKIICFIRD